MITCFFGVPGVGKTTLATKIAQRELKRIRRGRSIYRAVYTNFYCVGCNMITYDDLRFNKVYDSLLVFDELTLDADNRKFKEFTDSHRDFFVLHRHLGLDFIYLTQDYGKVDSKIRSLTQELWYMSRTVVPFFRRFTTAKRIYRNIVINEYSGELTLGYRFCNLMETFFTSNRKMCYRPIYYKYFDSYDEGVLRDRPVLVDVPWGNDKDLGKLLNKPKKNNFINCLNGSLFRRNKKVIRENNSDKR
jgi:hypothetical protein